MTFELDELRSAAWKLEENARVIKDMEMRKMMIDLAAVIQAIWHDEDQYKDGEESRPVIDAFKKKWFGNRTERLQGFVEERLAEVKQELMEMIGE